MKKRLHWRSCTWRCIFMCTAVVWRCIFKWHCVQAPWRRIFSWDVSVKIVRICRLCQDRSRHASLSHRWRSIFAKPTDPDSCMIVSKWSALMQLAMIGCIYFTDGQCVKTNLHWCVSSEDESSPLLYTVSFEDACSHYSCTHKDASSTETDRQGAKLNHKQEVNLSVQKLTSTAKSFDLVDSLSASLESRTGDCGWCRVQTRPKHMTSTCWLTFARWNLLLVCG